MKIRQHTTAFTIGGLLLLLSIVLIQVTVTHNSRHGFRTLDEIIQKGTLRIVSENSTLGITRIGNDSLTGLQYEILKAFADSVGVKLDITLNNDFLHCITGLMAGRYDLIAEYTPVTTQWSGKVSFTQPLLHSRQMLVQRIGPTANTLVKKQYELAGDSIFIPTHSPHRMRLLHLSDEIAGTIHIFETDNTTPERLVAQVSEGTIKQTICMEQQARKLRMQYQNIDVSLPVSLQQPYSWVVNSHSTALLEQLNNFLDKFIGSNDYWTLYRKYY